MAPAFDAAAVRRVWRLPALAAWLLTALPGYPQRWRPLAGTLRGWLAVRVRGQGWFLLPCALPVAASVQLRQSSDRAATAAGLGLRTAVVRAVRWLVPALLAVPLATLVNVLDDPSRQGWISETPAHLALLRMAPSEMPADERTGLLRQAVVAGNPDVVALLLDVLGPRSQAVDVRRLSRGGCLLSLSELAAADDPPEGITKAQRASRAAALGRVLQPFERATRAFIDHPNADDDELLLIVRPALWVAQCPAHKPPYWRGEWSVQALWPKDVKGALRPPRRFSFATVGSAEALRVAFQAGAIDALRPTTVLNETPLMLVLGELRRQRARAEAEREPALEADLRDAVQVLTQGDRSDLQVEDAAGRSVAWLAAAAGEGNLMRRAIAEGGPATLKGLTGMGSTLLHAAAIGGLAEEVDWLQEQGLKAVEEDWEGRTPLQVAATAEVARRLSR